MTMTYCRTCSNDVHITHDADACPACDEGDRPNVRTPDSLREPRE